MCLQKARGIETVNVVIARPGPSGADSAELVAKKGKA